MRRFNRVAWLGCSSWLILGGAAVAQEDPAVVQEVVVTGSRIVRDGTAAPTPVTLLSSETLAQAAPTNIPDALNQLPQLQNSRSQTANFQVNSDQPNAGNYLDLRGLGSVRTLIMLNGHRVPPTSYRGDVDANILPQILMERVEVVTGGASAAYGSDAVSGVVNFILDTRFDGVKGLVSGGMAQRLDSENHRLALAVGETFFNDKLYVLVSGEHYQNEGINFRHLRPNGDRAALISGTGTAANPFTASLDTRYARTSFGGVIVGGPLNNFHFLPGGVLAPFDPGTPTGTANISTGGDGAHFRDQTFTGQLYTDQLFARAEYELAPGATVYAQAIFGESRNRYSAQSDYRFGQSPTGRLTIFNENAFLTPQARSIIGATPSFFLGRLNDDFGRKWTDTLTTTGIAEIGGNGDLGRFKWDAYASHSQSILRSEVNKNAISRNFFAALDAVRDPTGDIVCRVTITNPGLLPGCVPLNIFGEGAPGSAALDFVLGTSQYRAVNRMDNAAINFTGEAFNLPAGPVAVAFGAEVRRQSMRLTSNADPAIPVDFTGIRGIPGEPLKYLTENVGTANGSYTVKEVYVEAEAPLLRSMPLAEELSVNAAARYTNYSTSGGVTTWKIGLSYRPTEDLRLRATVSQDIRAPTLFDLFAGELQNETIVLDPHTGTNELSFLLEGGNPDLQPERAKTLTIGGVYQPRWAPGFSASLDYYRIDISDGIGVLAPANILQECEDSGGTAPVCSLITRPLPFSDRTPANAPTSIRSTSLNIASSYIDGFDLETSYRLPLESLNDDWNGRLTFRLLSNYLMAYRTQTSATTPVVQRAGTVAVQTALPKWRGVANVTYENGPLTLFLQGRYVGEMRRTTANSAAVWDPKWQFLDSYVIADATVSYKIPLESGDLETFVTVNNLLDKKPPFVPTEVRNPGFIYPTIMTAYDVVGRQFNVGLRFRF